MLQLQNKFKMISDSLLGFCFFGKTEMECYDMHLRLWRESGILQICLQPRCSQIASPLFFIASLHSFFSFQLLQLVHEQYDSAFLILSPPAYNSLKCPKFFESGGLFEEIPFMKNCGITLIIGKIETSGRRRSEQWSNSLSHS